LRTLIVNFKNYPEVMGKGSLDLARAVESATASAHIECIVAPPLPMLSLVASEVGVKVFSQNVGSKTGDKTTGEVLPEAVKAAGASGTLLNHSESKSDPSELRMLVPRVQGLGLSVCLCSETPEEAAELAPLSPAYIAIEPPELIGSGIAVSRAKPELVSRTVSVLRRARYKGAILCGAGILTGEDVAKAVQLGADGVLVASSVVKAPDWQSKLRELAGSLT
jgi:triosephosphate isomerase (TIM)